MLDRGRVWRPLDGADRPELAALVRRRSRPLVPALPAPRRRGADPRRRQRADAARRGCRRDAARGARALRGRGRRDLPAQLLRQSRPRAAAARADAGGARRHPGLDLVRDLAARQGVRARVDDRDRRLHEAASSPSTRTSSTRSCASSASPATLNFADCAATLLPWDEALEQPFRIVFAGPAAGTISSARLGEAIGDGNLLCADVGGTSTDVSLVVDGQPFVNNTFELEHDLIINALSVEISSVGAGGGSIVCDLAVRRRHGRARQRRLRPRARLLRPRRHRADRHGRLPADGHPRPGRLRRRRDAARRGARPASVRVARHAASRSTTGSAYAYRIAVANIAEEVTNVAVRHGVDPRDFSLVAYGAAGPMLLPAALDLLQARARRRPAPPRAVLGARAAQHRPRLLQQPQLLRDARARDGAPQIAAVFEQMEARLRDESPTARARPCAGASTGA